MGSIRDLKFTKSDLAWIGASILINVLVLIYLLIRYCVIEHHKKQMFNNGSKIYARLFSSAPIVWGVTWLPIMIIHNHFYYDDINDVLKPLLQHIILTTVWCPLVALIISVIFNMLREK